MAAWLDELLTFAERAYVRMEAEQLIGQCLDQGDPALFYDLLKGLVLAGSSSLGVMREILEEVRSTRSSLMREGMTVRQDLAEALGGFWVDAGPLLSTDSPEAFRLICSQRLRDEARRAQTRSVPKMPSCWKSYAAKPVTGYRASLAGWCC